MPGDRLKPIAVLGAGSYGTALAIQLANNGNVITLWGRDEKKVALMIEQKRNEKYLPGIELPENLNITSSLEDASKAAQDILLAVPSHVFKVTLNRVKPFLPPDVRIVWASKGLDPDTGDLLEKVIIKTLGENIPRAILSGPSFAKELACRMPTAITLASNDKQFMTDLSLRFHSPNFRVYTSSDMVGVQLGGAVKNVVAVAAGIADGLGFGANTRTALITRGLAEMTRLGLKIGGSQETFSGMAGLGDLVLTCTDNQSRNRRFGLALGKGKTTEQALTEIGQVVEGYRNVKEVKMLSERHQVEMPITDAVYTILYQNTDPKEAAKALLMRDLKAEGE